MTLIEFDKNSLSHIKTEASKASLLRRKGGKRTTTKSFLRTKESPTL